VFEWNFWDFNEIDCLTRTCGHQLVRKGFGLFVSFFLVEDEKVEWLLRCVGLELDNFFDNKFCPKKNKEKNNKHIFLSMLYIVTRVDWDLCEEGI
jgi:hypothetical protein